MKRIFGVILAIFMILTGWVNVKADEVGATFAYSGESNVKLGESFAVDVVIKDVKGMPITGAIALVDYDREYLEFVSITPNMESPLAIFTNVNAVKFAGLSLTGEGIMEDTAILTIVFKTIKEGNTTLSFSELDLCDAKAKTVKGQMDEFKLKIEGDTNNLLETDIINNETIAVEMVSPNNVVEEPVKTSEKVINKKQEDQLDLTKEKEIAYVTNEKIITESQETKESNLVSKIINAIIDFFKELIFIK